MRPLIDAEAAAAWTDAVRIDVRWTLGGDSKEAEYAAGHLPGAVWLDFDRDVCGPAGPVGGRHPLPDPEALQAVLRAAGIDDDSPVLVYDDGDGMSAARTWWTLRWAGLEDVRVLTGGLRAWTEAGLPVEAQVPASATPASRKFAQRPEGNVTVRPGGLPVLDADGAAAWAAEHDLVDVRSPERYRGEFEPVDPVAGHIPGAVNRFLAEDDLGDLDRVRERYASLAEPAFYCGSGVGAARSALALTAAGRPTPPVYIGSWSDWGSRGRDVAHGEAS
ncbi:thiosulfate/3-mercaptopyruvate sulfurtransferase [Glycomyces sambucus]|uniref:Thiosulfate/3-mercaptopyruvate sulfurtransferase n=1 Tax=Glycomyces sambucus TaxID=380244 RepID=A0A1G9KFV9_9ACTN|nr:sulfurtransferase [Glycomyces sambucus]SDL48770.1 thiosulfate/3-mercaptopyruvate sulfurtransferase [Glycomyces sambucus]